MKGSLLFTTAMFVVGSGVWLLYDTTPSEPGRPGPSVEEFGEAASQTAQLPPVLVIVVRTPGLLETLREQTPAHRIALSQRDAIAMVDGRVFARGVEAASAPISALGWADRPLEIVDAGQVATRARAATRTDGGGVPPSLAQKDTLSLQEASQLLQQMLNEP